MRISKLQGKRGKEGGKQRTARLNSPASLPRTFSPPPPQRFRFLFREINGMDPRRWGEKGDFSPFNIQKYEKEANATANTQRNATAPRATCGDGYDFGLIFIIYS